MLSNSATHICTWIYRDTANQESHYPQMIGSSSSLQFLTPYWRCVVIYFASSLRHNPDAQHILFTNLDALPKMGRFDVQQFLHQNKIQVVQLPLTYQTPERYYGSWRNQFYIFDILKYIAQNLPAQDKYLILDSDCIWIKSVDQIAAAIEHHGLLTYELDLPPDFSMNGLTRTQMMQVFAAIGNEAIQHPPKYFGGEWFGSRGTEIARVAGAADAVWQACLQRFEQRLPKFNEEAHLLSYLYYCLNYSPGTANPFIRQIWTSRRFYNADRQDFDLTIWHVPAEKLYGFKRLFTHVCNECSPFWTIPVGDAFAQYLGTHLGIPRRTPTKLMLDAFDFASISLKKRLSNL